MLGSDELRELRGRIDTAVYTSAKRSCRSGGTRSEGRSSWSMLSWSPAWRPEPGTLAMIRRISFALAPLALLAALAAGCGGGGGGGSSSLGKNDLGIVGKTPITRAEFDAVVPMAEFGYKQQGRPFPKVGSPAFLTLQGQIMAFLVQNAELTDKAQVLGVVITAKQIETRLKQIKKQYFQGDEKKYLAQVKAQGLTDQIVRDDVKTQLVSDGLKKKVSEKVKISDQEGRGLLHGAHGPLPPAA